MILISWKKKDRSKGFVKMSTKSSAQMFFENLANDENVFEIRMIDETNIQDNRVYLDSSYDEHED